MDSQSGSMLLTRPEAMAMHFVLFPSSNFMCVSANEDYSSGLVTTYDGMNSKSSVAVCIATASLKGIIINTLYVVIMSL